MHRHGYKGRKLGRKRDQRNALFRNLAKQLITHGAIETTLPKAKEILPMTEKLITKAKKGDLASRRQAIAALDVKVGNFLVDVVAPQLKDRTSGYLRLEQTYARVGDNAQMAVVEFVDEIDFEATPKTEVAEVKEVVEAKKLEKASAKTTKKTEAKEEK